MVAAGVGSAARVSEVALEMACGPVSDSMSTELTKSTLQAGEEPTRGGVMGAEVGGDHPQVLFSGRRQQPWTKGSHTEMWSPWVSLGLGETTSLHLQEGPGPGGGKVWAGIPSGVPTHLPLASAGHWLNWQGPSYLSIHLWGLRQKFNSAGN